MLCVALTRRSFGGIEGCAGLWAMEHGVVFVWFGCGSGGLGYGVVIALMRFRYGVGVRCCSGGTVVLSVVLVSMVLILILYCFGVVLLVVWSGFGHVLACFGHVLI